MQQQQGAGVQERPRQQNNLLIAPERGDLFTLFIIVTVLGVFQILFGATLVQPLVILIVDALHSLPLFFRNLLSSNTQSYQQNHSASSTTFNFPATDTTTFQNKQHHAITAVLMADYLSYPFQNHLPNPTNAPTIQSHITFQSSISPVPTSLFYETNPQTSIPMTQHGKDFLHTLEYYTSQPKKSCFFTVRKYAPFMHHTTRQLVDLRVPIDPVAHIAHDNVRFRGLEPLKAASLAKISSSALVRALAVTLMAGKDHSTARIAGAAREAAFTASRNPFALALAEFTGRLFFRLMRTPSSVPPAAPTSITAISSLNGNSITSNIEAWDKQLSGSNKYLMHAIRDTADHMRHMHIDQLVECVFKKFAVANLSVLEGSLGIGDVTRKKEAADQETVTQYHARELEGLIGCLPSPDPSPDVQLPPIVRTASWIYSSHPTAVMAVALYSTLEYHQRSFANHAIGSQRLKAGVSPVDELFDSQIKLGGDIAARTMMLSALVAVSSTDTSAFSMKTEYFFTQRNPLAFTHNAILHKLYQEDCASAAKSKFLACGPDCHATPVSPVEVTTGPIKVSVVITQKPVDVDDPKRSKNDGGIKLEKDTWAILYTPTVSVNSDDENVWKIYARHWVMEHGTGRLEEVEAAGVGGKEFTLSPGGKWSYTSWTPFEAPVGVMQGEYYVEWERSVNAGGLPPVDRSFTVLVGPYGVDFRKGSKFQNRGVYFRTETELAYTEEHFDSITGLVENVLQPKIQNLQHDEL